jgi:hypothetical protein
MLMPGSFLSFGHYSMRVSAGGFTKRNTKSGKFVFQNDKNRNVVKKGHEIDQNRVPKRERDSGHSR